jgi:hypothetical protein
LTPDEWIARLGGLPLIDQPGRNFHYGHSTDLLGFLLARIEDATVSDVFARRRATVETRHAGSDDVQPSDGVSARHRRDARKAPIRWRPRLWNGSRSRDRF